MPELRSCLQCIDVRPFRTAESMHEEEEPLTFGERIALREPEPSKGGKIVLLPLIAITVLNVTWTVLSLRFVFLHRRVAKSLSLGPSLISRALPWMHKVPCALPNFMKILRAEVSDSTTQNVMECFSDRDVCL